MVYKKNNFCSASSLSSRFPRRRCYSACSSTFGSSFESRQLPFHSRSRLLLVTKRVASAQLAPPNMASTMDEVAKLQAELEAVRKELEQAKAMSPSASNGESSSLDLTAHDAALPDDPFAVTFYTIVLFGAEGNLSMKKTFPALFALMRQRHLPADIVIVGYARDALTKEQFHKLVYRAIYNIAHPESDRQRFLARIDYRYGQFDDPNAYNELRVALEANEKNQEDEWLAANSTSSNLNSPTGSPPNVMSSPLASGVSSSSSSGDYGTGSGGGGGAVRPSGSPLSTSSPDSMGVLANFRHVRAFYLAVPPFLYPSIAKCCRESGLVRRQYAGSSAPSSGIASGVLAAAGMAATPENMMDRFVLEKPFGKDTASCAELCSAISDTLGESQLYRIDHYLGKELVMNVLVMRFANISFNAIWNRHHIHSVHVVCKEAIGTYGRGGYFDQYGIIRDVMQNHLLQILALVGMEQPLTLSAEHIRQEKVKLLQCVAPLEMDDLLVGQFVAATGPGAQNKPGYLDDPSIANKQSTTETYAVAVLKINNPRWSGVPFVLKAGKALDQGKVEVRIRFHKVPGAIPAMAECAPNELVIRVQPDERIYWKITSKVPGLDFNVETRRMDLLYAQQHQQSAAAASSSDPLGRPSAPMSTTAGVKPPTAPTTPEETPGAYERLILEVLRGDQTNFVHADELLSSWRIFTPVLHELAAARNSSSSSGGSSSSSGGMSDGSSSSSSSSDLTNAPSIRPFPYAHGSAGPEAEERVFAAKFGFPAGFAHGRGGSPDDQKHNRLALAWGKASQTSLARAKLNCKSRLSSEPDSAAGSQATSAAPSV